MWSMWQLHVLPTFPTYFHLNTFPTAYQSFHSFAFNCQKLICRSPTNHTARNQLFCLPPNKIHSPTAIPSHPVSSFRDPRQSAQRNTMATTICHPDPAGSRRQIGDPRANWTRHGAVARQMAMVFFLSWPHCSHVSRSHAWESPSTFTPLMTLCCVPMCLWLVWYSDE